MRYKRMRQHLRSAGSFAGRPSFGFRIVGDAKAKQLEPDPIEAPALIEAVALYLGGKSLRYLCVHLDDKGVLPPMGGKWMPTTLSQIFRNPVIAGRQTDLAGKTVLRVPALIDKDTCAQLQAELDRKATRKGVAPSNSAMLTGVAVCAKCGGPMYRVNGSWKRADGTRVDNFYYRCAGTMTEPSRCKNMVRLAEVDAAVDAYLNGPFGSSPEFDTITIAGTGHEDEDDEIERDIRELDLDAPDYDDRLAKLRTERKRLKAEPQAKSFKRYVMSGRTYADTWRELDVPGKRAFLLRHGMVVRVLKGQEPEITIPGVAEVVIEHVAEGRLSIRVMDVPS